VFLPSSNVFYALSMSLLTGPGSPYFKETPRQRLLSKISITDVVVYSSYGGANSR
jgi:hypothetical protein